MSKIEIDGIDPDSPFDATELGAMMREIRVGMQRDIKDVAQELRIRRPYLEAIEDGRLDDLPGPAYTTGFLRVYSNYLGLDSEDIVKQFKQAGIDIDRRTNLTLPSPLEEGRLPSGSILMISAMLAVIAYAGWYFISSDDRSSFKEVASAPPPLASASTGATTREPNPDRAEAGAVPVSPSHDVLSAVSENRSGTLSGAEPPDAGVSTKPPPSQPAAAAADAAAPAPSAPPAAPPTAAQPAATAPPDPAEPSVEAVATARDAALDVAASAAPPAPPLVVERTSRAPSPTAGETQSPDGVVRQPLPDRTAAASPEPAASATPAGSATGAAATIRLVATGDSWVEIRSAQGKPLFSRLMRSGDTYDIASHPGLTLLTGNAGGLRILVDGKTMPPLGPEGRILQNVAIDADSLLARVSAAP